jgi:hypothetical protein
MKCPNCEMYFISPRFTAEEQDAFNLAYDDYISSRAALVAQYSPKEFAVQVDESIAERFRDVASWFPPGKSVLEIGAEKGGFLDIVGKSAGSVAAVDSCPEYVEILMQKGYNAYRSITEIPNGQSYDRVCLFSLLEHISEPRTFLRELKGRLSLNGLMIMEIPSAHEPLLELYDVAEFRSFYFQAMHPYVYSAKAAAMLLHDSGFEIVETRFKQRYGLSNHLQWLKVGAPGGNQTFEAIFSGAADAAYKTALEARGRTDTIYLVARHAGSNISS